MRITQEGDYALRVVQYLCRLGLNEKTEAKVIAEKERIPLRFLLKLLRKLTVAGIVNSYRGVGGGYAIAKLPKEISLKNVIEAIEGPIYVNKCLYEPDACNLKRADRCCVHNALEKVQDKLLEELENTTFKDIIEATR